MIAGLGNIGPAYDGTRHNIGFDVIESLARRTPACTRSFTTLYDLIACDRADAWLALCKPRTFMNRSGEAIVSLLATHELGIDRLLVVCDDAALPLGTLRLRANGTSGGHNGLASIIEHLGTSDFIRLRCGIGSPPPDVDYADYVLDCFSEAEAECRAAMIQRACDAIESFLHHGLDRTMTQFNAVADDDSANDAEGDAREVRTSAEENRHQTDK